MTEYFETVVIGAGQAGLATSYHLTKQNQNHVVIEKARIGEAWRGGKWDSFTLVTPNWMLKLPGFAYQGNEPDGFFTREEVIGYLDRYVKHFDPPVRDGVEVIGVEVDHGGFSVVTNGPPIQANNVVVAMGSYQSPKIPPFATEMAPQLVQLHSSHYRNPQQLPDGGVLVVGSGQSGCQIADELCQQGRKVYLSAGKSGSLPRRYRGHDVFWWAAKIGMLDRPVTKLPSPAARFVGNPQLTGRDGGLSLTLHRLALEGVVLLGCATAANGATVAFSGDLMESLANADRFAKEFREAIDGYIAENGLELPVDDEPILRTGYSAKSVLEVDLDNEGITSVIWATGYRFDFSWLNFPIYDEFGYPYQERGITSQPGLYFVGLQWLYALKSPLFAGVGEDAEHIVTDIVRRNEHLRLAMR